MKRYITFLLCVLLITSMTACQSARESVNQTEIKEPLVSSESTGPVDSTEALENGKAGNNRSKILVAYFAYSENVGDTSGMEVDAITSASLNAKTSNREGNLQVMARVIEEKTEADIFHIKSPLLPLASPIRVTYSSSGEWLLTGGNL